MEPPEAPRRIALVDANSFYCSAEKVWRPDLEHVPVVVLSNNDGCVVARDALVKKLGVPMGVPWFQLRDQARKNHWPIVAFSSNYELYGDMSRRFHTVLAQFCAPGEQERYSIDECFLDLSCHRIDPMTTGHEIKNRVKQWTGLGVCVGFGRSKTQAKLANNIAKKQPAFGGVCDLTSMTEHELQALLETVPVQDVWGVGRKIAEALIRGGITTAAQLRRTDPKRIRERFTVVVERTVSELNGVPCIAWEDQPPAKKQIISSRSFGGPIYTVDELADAVRMHAGMAAAKLRQQGSVAGRVGVFIETNRFRPQDPQYSPFKSIKLPVPSDDTAVITTWAIQVLRATFRPFRFVKAGVMLDDIRERGVTQGSLFDALPPERDLKREKLMGVLDKANDKWGRGTLGIGSAGVKGEREWSMNRSMVSPRYSTRWDELREVT
jgi:DNA polymerase V